jgi:hypothetical protein
MITPVKLFRRKAGPVGPRAEESGAANPYYGLRDRFLALTEDPQAELVRGAAFEMGTGGACATVICVADGTTSLYLSTGGGQIGLGDHEPIRRANAAFRDAVSRHLDLMAPVSEVPLVAQGEVHVLGVTADGLRLIRWREDALSDTAPDWPLYLAGQDVVTQIRILDEVRREPKTF